jgi:hypothetical protein
VDALDDVHRQQLAAAALAARPMAGEHRHRDVEAERLVQVAGPEGAQVGQRPTHAEPVEADQPRPVGTVAVAEDGGVHGVAGAPALGAGLVGPGLVAGREGEVLVQLRESSGAPGDVGGVERRRVAVVRGRVDVPAARCPHGGGLVHVGRHAAVVVARRRAVQVDHGGPHHLVEHDLRHQGRRGDRRVVGTRRRRAGPHE